MDKDKYKKAATHFYNGDIRAVIREGNKLFTDLNDPDKKAWTGHYKIWAALRAYQDEQRKKGVPIDLRYDAAIEWAGMDYTQHGQRYVFYTVENYMPRVQVYSSPFPRPDHRNVIARFTNFRWREGCPKGGKHE